MSSFSPKILAEAKDLAREMLARPGTIELHLPVGSEGGGLVLTVVEGGDVLEQFELEGKTFYIILPNTATEDDS